VWCPSHCSTMLVTTTSVSTSVTTHSHTCVTPPLPVCGSGPSSHLSSTEMVSMVVQAAVEGSLPLKYKFVGTLIYDTLMSTLLDLKAHTIRCIP